ncbi:MAG: hypothetical protein LC624_00750 [Halobacteriales archaeon]|nr:hypothetical protein [Halobacteriales archaeon]
MLWTIILVSCAFFVFTLLVAATGTLTEGWYLAGAAVWSVLLVLAFVMLVTERDQAAQPVVVQQTPAQALPVMVMPVMAAPPLQAPPVAERIVRTERVVYSTPRGQVIEVREGSNGSSRRTFIVEGDHEPLTSDDVERIVDARGWPAGERPDEEHLRAALQRWGRIRGEVP